MAKLYSQERSKYCNLTGQIIIWPVEINPDINSSSKDLNLAAELGKEVGKILKKKSKDSYKK